MTEIKAAQNTISRGFLRRGPNAFILASAVSGFAWYFAQQQTSNFNSRQSELIRRVEKDETAENFKQNFDYRDADNWDCKKVNLDGVIGAGRFLVKRNRGKQEGYLIMAPFIVSTNNFQTIFDEELYFIKNHNRKFLINLGWLPKSRKDSVFASIGTETFGEEVYTDRLQALEKEEKDGLIRDPIKPNMSRPITNVTAYIRQGEHEDKINGRINWVRSQLYKWIDLTLLTRAFRVPNEEEGEAIYLERTFKDAEDPESIPLQASKESVVEDLKTQSRHFQNAANRAKNGVTGIAFSLAAWMTFL